MPEATGEAELWPLVLAAMRYDPLMVEPWTRDQPWVDETFAELYLLGERPSVAEVRAVLADFGAREGWTKEITARWSKRLAQPGWRPRKLARGGCPWVRPFYFSESVIAEHGLRPVPDRLAGALAAAARAYMTRSASDPASAGASEELTVFALTAGAVRLWALVQDAVEGITWPSVLSYGLRKDNLAKGWTKTGREQDRARLDRLLAEQEQMWRRVDEALDDE